MAVKKVASQNVPTTDMTKAKDSSSSSAVGKLAEPTIAGVKQATSNPAKDQGVGVSLSDSAKSRISEQKRAKELAMNAPDVREERVNAIKSKIAAGTYQVDSDKIANGMMREAVMEHLTKDESR